MKARTWIASLTGATLAIAAGLVGAGSLTSANAVDTTVPTPTSGKIILATNYDTNGAGHIFWVPSGSSIGASDTLTQDLTTTTNNGCFMANATTGPTTTSPRLLNFTADNPKGTAVVGYQPGSNGGSIGASSKGGNATACTQVNDKEGESLTIDLNSPATSVPSQSTPKVQAVKATLDIEAKGNVIITATLFNSNSTGTSTATGEVFTLYSGKSQLTGTLKDNQANCNVTTVADSGPDAGSGDNCAWSIRPNKTFDKVVLATSGPSGSAFSVEGGGDWAVPADHYTVFDVVTNAMGVLDCGATTASYTNTTSGNVTTAQVTRANNGPVSGTVPDCQLIPYALGTGAGTATFHKPLTDQATAQFSWDFTRTISLNANTLGGTSTPFTVVGPVAPLAVNWEDAQYKTGTSPQDTVSVLTYCPAGLYTGLVNGVPTFNYSKVTVDLSPDTSGAPGTQYACKYAETQTFDAATGKLTVRNLVYLTGDAILKSY